MNLSEKLRSDLTRAVHDGDTKRVATLRMLFAAIKNKEIEERKKDIGLGEDELLGVIHKEAKKRKDAIVEFEKGGRPELAAREREELKILEQYMPAELSDAEILRVVSDGIRELGEAGPAQFGALMKLIMPTLKNRASGDRITSLVKKALEKS